MRNLQKDLLEVGHQLVADIGFSPKRLLAYFNMRLVVSEFKT